jgi:hypothetical protein
VPTGYELGLGVAVQSYDGRLFFGVTADAHVAPDAARLRDYIQSCFQELAKAAGVRAAPHTAKRRSPAKPRAAKRRTPAGPVLVEPVQTAEPIQPVETVESVQPAAPVEPEPVLV